ncbi:protoporphyrinogen oxidase [Fictibacillus aquaticus]|uniref:Coproporphyrinogen III oxidase n=1 Tax=Fictibacillus aquaticus TaxID=2021314 RepID=A0A235FEX1_9BACL|nr:protoporphyrinogen oxidase [Fictibacillus aquaticus]OYD59699.1 protoporphyrinogen oxidase [Fictibacillus aquaticus]
MDNRKHVIIAGGGITGLAAAFFLQEEAQKSGRQITFTVVEGSSRLGGKIETFEKDGFVIERGPDSYLARKSIMTELIEKVGLKDDIVPNNTGQAYILHGEKLHPIPEGAVMGIPTKLRPFITTGLFSWPGKLRAGIDLVMPKRKNADEDISVGHFFKRRLGHEAVERLIEPLLSGIYAGDIDKISLQSTFPQFAETEEKSRSLILGMKQSQPKSSGKPKKAAQFRTLKHGLSSFVEALANSIPKNQVWLEKKVVNVEKGENEKLHALLDDGTVITGDNVILTTPYAITKTLLPETVFPEGFHETIPTSVATVAMAFPEESITFKHEGTGFVIARSEDYTMTACTWTNRKWPHTVPDGKVLIRCYVGRADDQEIVFEDDEEILRRVLIDLERSMGITAKPEFYLVSRLVQSMPQYDVGHKEKVAELRDNLQHNMPGVHVAGAPYDGVGLPDCIASAKMTVNKILENH